MQEYVAEYCEKCNVALNDARMSLEERAQVLESNANQVEYELRYQYKQKEEELAQRIHEQSTIINGELNRMKEEHRLRMHEIEHEGRMERQKCYAEYQTKEQALVEDLSKERAALQAAAHKEFLHLGEEAEEKLRVLRRMEQQLHSELEKSANQWEEFVAQWHKDCVPVREALVNAVRQVHSSSAAAEKAREEAVHVFETQLQRQVEQHLANTKSEAAAHCDKIAESHRAEISALEVSLRTVQEEARSLREQLSRVSSDAESRQAKRDGENRRNLEVWESERDAERQHMEATMKRLRDSLHEEREDSRCAQQRMHTECEVLQRTIRELQAALAAERTACSQKECDMIVEVEKARAEIAAAHRDSELRTLTMKEEVDARVRHEVETFKRRYLDLRDTTVAALTESPQNTHAIAMDSAGAAVAASQNLRVRRLREWTTTAVTSQNGSQHRPTTNSQPLSDRAHLSPRRLLEDARVIQSGLSSRSASGASAEVQSSRVASDAYQRLQNLTERLKGHQK
jgi:hypothetical protein